MALYDKEHGFYSSGEVKISKSREDFCTYPEYTEYFGHVIALQLFREWKEKGKPPEYDVAEFGAGEGGMANGIFEALNERSEFLPESEYEDWTKFSNAVQYYIVEASPALIYRQQERLRRVRDKIEWVNGSVFNIPFRKEVINGSIISNELPDAFSLHKVKMVSEELMEVYIAEKEDCFIEEDGKLSNEMLKQYYDYMEIKLKDGDPTSLPYTFLNLHASEMIIDMSRVLEKGSTIITVDYGYPPPSRFYDKNR